ncbi:uncharacterized protein [Temnothorax nylanderi]
MRSLREKFSRLQRNEQNSKSGSAASTEKRSPLLNQLSFLSSDQSIRVTRSLKSSNMNLTRSLKLKILLLLLLLIYYMRLKRMNVHKRWQNRRWLVRPVNQQRKQQGEYDNLFQELKNDEEMFFKYTRMNIQHFNKLLNMLECYLVKRTKRALPPEQRLLITLRYLATGNSTSNIAFSFRVGQSTVRKLIKEVCPIITNKLRPIYLTCPTEEQWKNISDGYWNQWNIPNCFGAIDGKHILLRCPPNSGSLYFNYKKQFSIVLMAISDHLYRFSLVDIGAYGGNSDGGVFESSNIGKNLNNGLNLPTSLAYLPGSNISMPGFFIADAAFPLCTRIMKPYSGKNLTEKQRIYNYRHSRARRTVESAFGIYANRWRVFHTAISMLPETADLITIASVCLHNYVMYEEQKDGLKEYSQEVELETSQWLDVQNTSSTSTRSAITQRDILSEYFVSSGQVDFQYEYIHREQHSDYL